MASAGFTASSADNYGAQVGQNFGSIVNHFNTRTDNPASQLPRPSPPPPSAIIPFRRDRDFVDRSLLDDILQRAAEPGTRIGLVGLGGVG
jgi:hypothetical protein